MKRIAKKTRDDDRRILLRLRGRCTGPLDGAPVPGSVGLDYKAPCCTCGRRVAITKRGLFTHHRPNTSGHPAPGFDEGK